ncbi:MAG: class I SAM-dependent methyltransferase [Bacteroidetes bacterium]|nr:class I SAM-dependent methyltransferase [Bacteroidota bacterium]
MPDHLFRFVNLLEYHTRKKGLHSLHSPFVYKLATEVLRSREAHPSFDLIKKARRLMLSNRNVIETVDFGANAGNSDFKTYRIRVNKLAKKRISGHKEMEILNRLARYMEAKHILEFGTSTGLSSVALATSHSQAHLTTMEGCASVASVAQAVFEKLGISNIELEIGNFNSLLPIVLQKLPRLDMVFFDGNHRKQATINYFHHCLTKAHPGSVFVFDDIRWSAEMYEAWKEIAAAPEVSVSIELKKLGIVFFRQGIEKQHFVLS